jgi:benzoyl-CoA 2,3-dioxygenase component B
VLLAGSNNPLEEGSDGKKRISPKEVALRTAMNEILRQDYTKDCQRGVDRWNKTIAGTGIDFELRLPSPRFHRHIGTFRDAFVDVQGNVLTDEQWQKRRNEWLPTQEDDDFVSSLMKPVVEPGKIAGWIAPPAKGINGQPFELEYVRFH